MAWIELHQTLPRHPKLFRLASRLRVTRAQAAGHLTFLWLWTLDYAPTGDLSAFGPAEISAAADFSGDAELFAQALRETGWIDGDDRIHDWEDYAGRLLEDRAQAKERMRAFRQRQREEKERERLNELPERADTLRERSELPDRTLPNRTEPDSPPRASGTTPRANAAKRRPAGVEDVILTGQRIGLSEIECRAWWADMEEAGWAKIDGTPFGNWPRELTVHRDRLRERGQRNGATTVTVSPPNAPTAFTLKSQLQALDEEIKIIHNRGREDGSEWYPKNDADRQRYIELKKKRREVNAKLAEVT